MKSKQIKTALACVAAIAAIAGCANVGGNPMTFFITSANPGKGGDLGGLAGADAYCEQLAASVGAGGKGWRAYLSTQATDKEAAVNAKDRIGNGPWVNAKGVVVAYNSAELHYNNALNKASALTEKGEGVSGRGDPVNMHDVLTGTRMDGTAPPSGKDATCSNWTSSTTGSALVGHHDRIGLSETLEAKSWNASHGSRGCDMPSLKATGGAGLFYCFATK